VGSFKGFAIVCGPAADHSEYIISSYTMGTSALPDINALAFGPLAQVPVV